MAPIAPLSAVIANDELARRPLRPSRDERAERDAYHALTGQLAQSPRGVLQALTDAAMRLCEAHSAGVSLLEEQDGSPIFRWHALSGEFAHNFWGTMPREHSPCGTVLDRRGWQLMIEPERHFTALREVRPKVLEALLEPFWVRGEAKGTIWVLSHDPARRFDDEDRRVLWRLAKFAAVAYEQR